MKSCKQLLLLNFIALMLISSLSAHALEIPSSMSVDGRDIKVETDTSHSKRVTNRRVRKGPKVHTVKAYATMYATFLASMIMTEKWYCDQRLLGFANTDFTETPTCHDEMYQMAKDPSMHVGILAMTYTSLAYSSWANRKSRKLLIRALKFRAKTPIKLLETFNQSIGMGFGITVQTLINSTYNSPSIGKCFKEMKAAALDPNSTVEKAMESKICKDGYDSFVSMENGTASEIHIAIMSLVVSTAATATVMTSVRGAAIVLGHVLGKTNIIGWSVTGVMMASNFLIEFFDRAIEKYVRAYYHNRRSRGFLQDDFEKIIKELNEVTGSSGLLKEVRTMLPCDRKKCQRRKYANKVKFPLMESYLNYQYNINYKRRALLNTFLDSQSRWKQKLSGTHDAFNQYKDFLNLILEARSERALFGQNLDDFEEAKFNFNPFFAVGYDLQAQYSDPSLYQNGYGLTEEQKDILSSRIKAVIEAPNFSDVINMIREGSQTIPALLYKSMKKTLETLESNKIEDFRIELWKLKELTNLYFTEKHTSMFVRHIDEIKAIEALKASLSGVTAVHPLSARTLAKFESKGLAFETSEKETATGSKKRGRKGTSVETENIDVLKLHDDVSEDVEHSEFKLANMLIHSVCNPNTNVIFDFNSGDISKVTLPHLIDLNANGKVDCRSNFFFPTETLSNLTTEDDFIFNPQNGAVTSLQKNAAMHGLYEYNGKTYIGLLDLLTDPAVPIRWKTEDDIKDFWFENFIPKYMGLIGEGKEKYYDMLFNEFWLYDRSNAEYDKVMIELRKKCQEQLPRPNKRETGHKKSRRVKACALSELQKRGAPDKEVLNRHIHSLLSNDEAKLRTSRLSRKDNRDGLKHVMHYKYYHNISPGQTFLDQVRTAHYTLTKLGMNNAQTDFLADLLGDLEKMLEIMDIPNYTRPISSEFTAADLVQHPMLKIMGPEKLGKLGQLINKVLSGGAQAAQAFADAPDYKDVKESLSKLSHEEARRMYAKEVFKGINEMLNTGLISEIFTDYLTADGFIYSKPQSNDN